MYKGKTLVAVGCSHVYGVLSDDQDQVRCHDRSWVRSLEKLGNFSSSVNLGLPGGTNDRSVKVLLDYIKNNYSENLVVIFSVTELSRFERYDTTYQKYITFGNWSTDDNWSTDHADDYRIKYARLHYGHFSDNNHDEIIINQQMLMLHTLLTQLKIEHYFFEMLNPPGTLKRNHFEIKLPIIEFPKKGNNMLDNAGGFIEKVGEFKHYPCGHYDKAANDFLAEYMFNYIKGMKNGI